MRQDRLALAPSTSRLSKYPLGRYRNTIATTSRWFQEGGQEGLSLPRRRTQRPDPTLTPGSGPNTKLTWTSHRPFQERAEVRRGAPLHVRAGAGPRTGPTASRATRVPRYRTLASRYCPSMTLPTRALPTRPCLQFFAARRPGVRAPDTSFSPRAAQPGEWTACPSAQGWADAHNTCRGPDRPGSPRRACSRTAYGGRIRPRLLVLQSRRGRTSWGLRRVRVGRGGERLWIDPPNLIVIS